MQDDHKIIQSIGSKTGAAMWKEIDDLVTRWATRNPVAANWNRHYNQAVRDELTDKKHGTLNNEGMAGGRMAISVHPELMNYIETFYPKFFESKENIRRFGKTYKMFQIPEEM